MKSWIALMALAVLPTVHAEEVETHVYVEHSTGPLHLDIHRPVNTNQGASPCILWFHGGGWRNGSRENWKMLSWVLEHGYAIVSIDYRLSNTATFPAQKSDGEAALGWIRENGREHGIDPDHIIAAGPSAGAHLASLTGLSADKSQHSIRGIIHFYGPSDFILMSRQAKELDSPLNRPDSNVYQLFGGPLRERHDLARSASPVSHLDSSDPPLLILVGSQDSLMTQRQCRRLHEAAINAGVDSRLHVIDGAGHGGPEFFDETRQTLILDFLSALP
ncbi:MAG: alpha/beta hydrolase [Verrucomicrobiota bacterium]